MRNEFWYLFSLAAAILILLRLRPTRRADHRDPVTISFTLGLFLAALGTLSKTPPVARFLDSHLGPNAAWLLADSLFLAGLCAGTYWVDLMRLPELRKIGGRLLASRRVAALVVVIGWMVAAALLGGDAWSRLERGGIDVAGQPGLLLSRLAYFGYSMWGLSYLSYQFYLQRMHMRDRFNYVRLTIPWAAITLAIAAPALQLFFTILGFANRQWLGVWPGLWVAITVIQLGVAVLIITTFFRPAYRFVSWLDKQALIRRLLRIRDKVNRRRPDLLPDSTLPRPGLIVRQPDQYLATLVAEMEMVKHLIAKEISGEIAAPAGSVMPDEARFALREEQTQFLRGLSQELSSSHRVTGSTYSLARWYASLNRQL